MLKGILICSVFGLLVSTRTFTTLEVREVQADKIKVAFCYVSNEWARPNTTIYAQNRSEADKQGKPKGLTFCKPGPCELDGELNPTAENCTF